MPVGDSCAVVLLHSIVLAQSLIHACSRPLMGHFLLPTCHVFSWPRSHSKRIGYYFVSLEEDSESRVTGKERCTDYDEDNVQGEGSAYYVPIRL